MFFRRQKHEVPSGNSWTAQAGRLGFESVTDAESAAADSIDLHTTPLLSGVFAALPAAGLTARAFEFRSDQLSGSLPVAAFACVLLAAEPFCPAVLRFSRKLPAQLETITAASNQAVPFSVTDDPVFSGSISVLVREPRAAERVLGPVLRRAVLRAAGRHEAAFLLTASGKQLFLQLPAENAGGDMLECMMSDLLTIWAALRSSGKPAA